MNKRICIIALMLTCKICSSQIVPPYFNDFEADTIGWHSDAVIGNGWQWDTTNFGACSGLKVLGLGLDTNNLYSQATILYSPVFDFTTITNATLCFSQKFNTLINWDGTGIEYTVNGASWSTLGSVGQGLNWYNTPFLYTTGLPGWSGVSPGCLNSSISLNNLNGNSPVQFRFIFKSNDSLNLDEYIIDDFRICDSPCICNSSVGVNQILQANNSFNISPNPFSGKLNFTINNNELSEIIIYDIASRKILEQEFLNPVTLNTEQLAKGIYLYEVRNKNGVIKKGKVVKE
jgi:hypothetical protein